MAEDEVSPPVMSEKAEEPLPSTTTELPLPVPIIPGDSLGPSQYALEVTPEKHEMSKTKKLAYFLYNPKSKTVLGRTGMSWLRIAIFYVIFYFFLFTFFYLCLLILISFMGVGKPYISAGTKPRILYFSNGLSVFPPAPAPQKTTNKKNKIESATIYYDMNNEKTSDVYINILTETLNEIKEYKEIGDVSGCTKENGFGYKSGQPCVILRFNRVFGWEPKPMEHLEKYLKDNYYEDSTHPKNFREYMKYIKRNNEFLDAEKLSDFMRNNVGVHCVGDGEVHKGTMGDLTYFPKPGIPVKPFQVAKESHSTALTKAERWNWTPYIFVKFLNPQKNTLIEIVCRAFEKNMDLYHAKQGVGSVRFSLFIRNTK